VLDEPSPVPDDEASARIAGDDNEASLRTAADWFLQTQIDELAESGSPLDPFVTVNNNPMNGLAGPHIIFEGANVNVRSGSGATNDGWSGEHQPEPGSLLGLGNLIVGYNENQSPFGRTCTDPYPSECLREGPNYVNDVRTGSHNLIVGPEHTYTSFGGLIAGWSNAVTHRYSSVTAGLENEARGPHTLIAGGGSNLAVADQSTLVGSSGSTTFGMYSTISGGTNRGTPDLYAGYWMWIGGNWACFYAPGYYGCGEFEEDDD